MSRPSSAARGYGKRWQELRKEHLAREPWCRFCAEQGRKTKGTVVDHIEPHRGDPRLLYDPNNLQTLCAPCHNGSKHREEVTGRVPGCDAEGVPLDEGHHWRRSG